MKRFFYPQKSPKSCPTIYPHSVGFNRLPRPSMHCSPHRYLSVPGPLRGVFIVAPGCWPSVFALGVGGMLASVTPSRESHAAVLFLLAFAAQPIVALSQCPGCQPGPWASATWVALSSFGVPRTARVLHRPGNRCGTFCCAMAALGGLIVLICLRGF